VDSVLWVYDATSPAWFPSGPSVAEGRSFEDVEHVDRFVLFPAFFAGHFFDEAIRFEIIDDLVGGPASVTSPTTDILSFRLALV
jgi:hypothetical protein